MLFDEKIIAIIVFLKNAFQILNKVGVSISLFALPKIRFLIFIQLFNKNLHGQNPYCG
jgi:hypothetical protein